MNLNELDIQEDYRSDRDNLIDDFYIPCLGRTTIYSRAVGFFSSSSLIAVSKGLAALIQSGGKMRLVASPCLSREDINAIEMGLKRREEVITSAILRELDREFERVHQDRLACLAWLLSQGILEIKLAISQNLHVEGLYHEKFGIFSDFQNHCVAFIGSANESFSGFASNFEYVEVFRSWKQGEQTRVQRKINDFQRLWDNKTSKVEVIDFPEAATRSLLRLRPNSPPQFQPSKQVLVVRETGGSYELTTKTQKLELRPFQIDAIEAFGKANSGILAMATGTGKTITALTCASRLNNLDLIVIGVPTKELVNQWVEEIETKTSFRPPIAATGKAEYWREILFRKLRLIDYQELPRERLPVIVVGTYSELSKSPVTDLIGDAGGLPKQSLLIADEVHATGAEVYRRILREDFRYRLGLSATPIRPYDEEGTEVVLDYFGGIVYEFTLEDAIAAGILCQYDYHVYVTTLTDEEHEKFQQLTAKIASLLNRDDRERIHHLTIQRAKVIKSATTKLNLLDRILNDYPPQQAMIYCADIDQATQISKRLSQRGFNIARYSSDDRDRKTILTNFAKGYLDALVAVKCLDEGVDIPSVHQAIILASDATERQFIQRRGRILRTAPKKSVATLIDVLIVPPLGDERVKLIESELQRIKQFARSARNRTSVIINLIEELKHYGITYSDLI
ncbi:MAG: DEAD/DEAH box helicase family protein [Hydrococcus sp. Prado102]|nr:DEAD/DEAH box helicase family protein [Hydrococcus sp. Prado102]